MIAVTVSSSLNWSGTLFLTSYFAEYEPKGGVRSARLDQVLAQANAGEITQSDGRHRQDRHRDGDLSQDRGPDRRMPPLQAGLLQKLFRQVHDSRPNPFRQHLPDQGEVFRSHAVFAVLFKREAQVSQPPESIFLETADGIREANEPAAQIDRIGLGYLPILAPVAVEDFLGDIRIDQRAQ